MDHQSRRIANRDTALQIALVLLFVALTVLGWSALTAALISGG